jgi:antitoxin ParD1/3/4
MATMNISLPDQMKQWVEDQTRDGKYANASDYVRDLIRKEQVKAEKIAALQAKIDEGLASGVSTRSMADIRADGQRRFLANQKARA